MDTALWVVAIVLALLFGAAGLTKLSQPKEKLRDRLAWVDDFSQPTVRFIGFVEVLAAIGLFLPALIDVAPVLVPLAATGLAVVMVLAAVVHVRRDETQMVAVNAVLLALAVFVAWGRFGPESF